MFVKIIQTGELLIKSIQMYDYYTGEVTNNAQTSSQV